MYIAEVKCLFCDTVYDIFKNKMVDDWPTDSECPHCACKASRRIYKLGDIAVGIGKCGNESTGYGTEMISLPGKYGYFKGTKVDRSKKS